MSEPETPTHTPTVAVRGSGRGRGRGGRQPMTATAIEDGWRAIEPTTQALAEPPPPPPAHVAQFTVRAPGPRHIPNGTNKLVDFFGLFVSDDILTPIV